MTRPWSTSRMPACLSSLRSYPWRCTRGKCTITYFSTRRAGGSKHNSHFVCNQDTAVVLVAVTCTVHSPAAICMQDTSPKLHRFGIQHRSLKGWACHAHGRHMMLVLALLLMAPHTGWTQEETLSRWFLFLSLCFLRVGSGCARVPTPSMLWGCFALENFRPLQLSHASCLIFPCLQIA